MPMPRQFQLAIITETLVADTTAQTATDTLRHDLGLGDRLGGLTRKEVWLLRLETAEREEALAITRALAAETKLFVNPNKHRFAVRYLSLQVTPPDPEPLETGGYRFCFVVRFRDDTRGAMAREALQGLYHVGKEVVTIDAGMWWELVLRETSAEEAAATFERLLLARDAETGLFANPHSQLVFFPTTD
jgi:hypothetical protein